MSKCQEVSSWHCTPSWQSIIRKVTWRRFDQSAKQLVVGQTTINNDTKLTLLTYYLSVKSISHSANIDSLATDSARDQRHLVWVICTRSNTTTFTVQHSRISTGQLWHRLNGRKNRIWERLQVAHDEQWQRVACETAPGARQTPAFSPVTNEEQQVTNTSVVRCQRLEQVRVA